MRSPMPRQGRPSGSAPRRMRRTLYCVPVQAGGFQELLRLLGVGHRRPAAERTKIRSCSGMETPEDLERKTHGESIVVITTMSRGKIGRTLGYRYGCAAAHVDFTDKTARACVTIVSTAWATSSARAPGKGRWGARRRISVAVLPGTNHADAIPCIRGDLRPYSRKTDNSPFGGAINTAVGEGVFARQGLNVDNGRRRRGGSWRA